MHKIRPLRLTDKQNLPAPFGLAAFGEWLYIESAFLLE
jgi:hypothetical protein